jgi:hypothetical protein
MMNKLFVVTHLLPKKLLPAGYSYIKVGTGDLSCDYTDSQGENIADKNETFCELTAMYWIWKNYQCHEDDFVGIAHYRRLMAMPNYLNFLFMKPLTVHSIKEALTSVDILLPNEEHFPQGIYHQYSRVHPLKDLNLCIDLLNKIDPSKSNVESFLRSKKSASVYNMLICKKKIFDEYCEWLFPILFYLEKLIDLSGRTPYQRRAIGFLSERLLNIWLFYNPQYLVKNFPVLRLDLSIASNLNRLRRGVA